MPPICLHMVIAKEAAESLCHPVLDRNLGSYLLGASAPDIRVITPRPREETHFFDLGNEHSQSGVTLLFEAYPYLADAAELGEGTRAFIAGYLSHLITDEIWIIDIYRPFFGRPSSLAGDPEANLMDRALQFELDRRERLDRGRMAQIQVALCNAGSGVAVKFIDAETLEQWRRFACHVAGREPTWEGFRLYAERFLLPEQQIELKRFEALLDFLPPLLARAFQIVTEERLDAFRQKAMENSVKTAREYLK